MRRDAPRPQPVPQLIRGAVAQQQVRAGVAQEAALEALPPVYANDAEAAANDVPVGAVYRNGQNYVVREL